MGSRDLGGIRGLLCAVMPLVEGSVVSLIIVGLFVVVIFKFDLILSDFIISSNFYRRVIPEVIPLFTDSV